MAEQLDLGVEYNEKVKEGITAAEAVVVADTVTPSITFSSGVTLESLPVNPFMIQEVMLRFSLPEMPKLWDEDSQSWIVNPNHPRYVAECEQIELQRSHALFDVVIAFGTRIKETPDGFPQPDDTGWSEELEEFGYKIASKGRARYRDWVRYMVARQASDLEQLAKLFGLTVGTAEVGISAQMSEKFPSDAQRDGATGVPA